MSRRWLLTLPLGLGLVMALAWAIMSKQPPLTAVTTSRGAAAAQTGRVSRAPRPAPSLARKPEATPTRAGRVDLNEVRAAIARLDELSSLITQEELDQERELMQKKAKEFAMVETPEPARSKFVDETGRRWIRLEYPSGEVRYEFPED